MAQVSLLKPVQAKTRNSETGCGSKVSGQKRNRLQDRGDVEMDEDNDPSLAEDLQSAEKESVESNNGGADRKIIKAKRAK